LLIFRLSSGKKIPLRILRDLCGSAVNHFPPKHRGQASYELVSLLMGYWLMAPPKDWGQADG